MRKKPLNRAKIARRLKKALDAQWSRLTKLKWGKDCAWCGLKGSAQSDHIANRWKHPTRWNIDNMVPLCVGCHIYRKKRDPAGWAQMVINRIGQDKFDALLQESNRAEKVDMDQVKVYLDEWEKVLTEKTS